jgi:hypothetical protein
MNKILIMLLLMAGMAGWSHAQQVPKEVQNIIDNYTKDSSMDFGFNFVKKAYKLDKDLGLSDIMVGAQLEVYGFNYKLLDSCSDTVSIKKIIQPANIWYMLIEAHGKYIYDIEIYKEKGKWVPCGLGKDVAHRLQDVMTERPHIFKTNPILIEDAIRKYLYFPQSESHKLLYLNPLQKDSLEIAISNAGDSLVDSRLILNYRKKLYQQQKPKREEFLRNHPNFFKQENNSGGGE